MLSPIVLLLTLSKRPARLPACGSFYACSARIKHPWQVAIAATVHMLAALPNTCRRPSLCGRPVVNLLRGNLLLPFRKLPVYGIWRSGRLLIGPWCWATCGAIVNIGRVHLAPQDYVTLAGTRLNDEKGELSGAAVFALTRPPSLRSGSPRFRARREASGGRRGTHFGASLSQRH